MNISGILEMDSKKVTNAEKLAQIVTIVASTRKNYGNADVTIKAPEVDTTDGKMAVKYVNDASKLALVKSEVVRIKMAVIEACKADSGKVANKIIDEMVATSAILVNIGETSDFSIL